MIAAKRYKKREKKPRMENRPRMDADGFRRRKERSLAELRLGMNADQPFYRAFSAGRFF